MHEYEYVTKMLYEKLMEEHNHLRQWLNSGLITQEELADNFLPLCRDINNILKLMQDPHLE